MSSSSAFNTPIYSYEIAGRKISFNIPIPSLTHSFQGQDVYHSFSPALKNTISSSIEPDIRAKGWLLDNYSEVSLYIQDEDYLLMISGEWTYWIMQQGKVIFEENADLEQPLQHRIEMLLGAPLVFALALQQTWCLHASAVEIGGKVAIFLGQSGSGKSTLASYLAENTKASRVSDDILPVLFEENNLVALPHFPQLKLPDADQPSLTLTGKLPITKIYLIEEHPKVSLRILDQVTSAVVLLSHTVGSLLFCRPQLEQNFDFCCQASLAYPVSVLSYPHIFSEMGAVSDWIHTDLFD